jgi:hypothetical protein
MKLLSVTPSYGGSELARIRLEIDAYDAMMWARIGLHDSGDGWLAFTSYGARFVEYDELCDRRSELLWSAT